MFSPRRLYLEAFPSSPSSGWRLCQFLFPVPSAVSISGRTERRRNRHRSLRPGSHGTLGCPASQSYTSTGRSICALIGIGRGGSQCCETSWIPRVPPPGSVFGSRRWCCPTLPATFAVFPPLNPALSGVAACSPRRLFSSALCGLYADSVICAHYLDCHSPLWCQ